MNHELREFIRDDGEEDRGTGGKEKEGRSGDKRIRQSRRHCVPECGKGVKRG